MHPYLANLKKVRDMHFANSFAMLKWAIESGLAGMAFAYFYSQQKDYGTSGIICATLLAGAVAASIGFFARSYRQSCIEYNYVQQHPSEFDARFYSRYVDLAFFEEINSRFTPAEIDQIAREALANDLYDHYYNMGVRRHLPTAVHQRVTELKAIAHPAVAVRAN